MNITNLSELNDEQLTDLLIRIDKWNFDANTNQLFKIHQNNKITFDSKNFNPFTNETQAKTILKTSHVNYSDVIEENGVWGLCVFKNNNEKNLILKSNSYHKSSLMFLIALKLGIIV